MNFIYLQNLRHLLDLQKFLLVTKDLNVFVVSCSQTAFSSFIIFGREEEGSGEHPIAIIFVLKITFWGFYA